MRAPLRTQKLDLLITVRKQNARAGNGSVNLFFFGLRHVGLSHTVSGPLRSREMQQEDTPRSLPVIAITGTPGTGKTTHAQLLVEQSPVPLQHINVSELVKEKMLHDGFDEEWQTYVVDEDKVCSYSSSWLGTGMMCQI